MKRIVLYSLFFPAFVVLTSCSSHSDRTSSEANTASTRSPSASETETPISDCVFDQATQTDEFMQQFPQFEEYTWDSELKEAHIPLGDGDSLIIKRGGCVHFGYYGTLILRNDTTAIENNEYWFSKAQRLAKTLFTPTDYQLFDQLLTQKAYDVLENKELFYYSFDQDVYCDMGITLDFSHKARGVKIVEVGFYLC